MCIYVYIFLSDIFKNSPRYLILVPFSQNLPHSTNDTDLSLGYNLRDFPSTLHTMYTQSSVSCGFQETC